MGHTALELAENKLRRMASRQGKRLVKLRVYDPRALNYGKYLLLGEDEPLPEYTGKPRTGALTLGQVEEKLLYPLEEQPYGRHFTEEQLREEWAVDEDYVAQRVVATHRWYEERSTIFMAPDDAFYYEVILCYGLTETQEIDPFDGVPRTPERIWCPRMEQRPVTELKWVPVK